MPVDVTNQPPAAAPLTEAPPAPPLHRMMESPRRELSPAALKATEEFKRHARRFQRRTPGDRRG